MMPSPMNLSTRPPLLSIAWPIALKYWFSTNTTSYGRRPSAIRVKARRSANSTAISRSIPWPGLTCTRTSRGPVAGRQQRHDLEIVARPELAGEAHAAVGDADPRQHPGLVGGGRRRCSAPVADPHPAGRAAPAPAADRCMRNANRAAGLEHAHAGSDRDPDAARVAQADQAARRAGAARAARGRRRPPAAPRRSRHSARRSLR